jgi:hypothetical protein
MNVQERNEIRELTAVESDEVTGGLYIVTYMQLRWEAAQVKPTYGCLGCPAWLDDGRE